MGHLYNTIVQSVLLDGSETWVRVMSTVNLRKLSSFHHRCARFFSKRHIKPNDDGIWNHPPTEDTCLFSIETCMQRRRTTISNFVKELPIYQMMFMDSEVQLVKNNTGGSSTFVHKVLQYKQHGAACPTLFPN